MWRGVLQVVVRKQQTLKILSEDERGAICSPLVLGQDLVVLWLAPAAQTTDEHVEFYLGKSVWSVVVDVEDHMIITNKNNGNLL